LGKQGFKINPHLRPKGEGKRTLKLLQRRARIGQIAQHRRFLMDNFDTVADCLHDGRDIKPAEIKLELREVRRGSTCEVLYRWWNLVWWSIPYQRSYGRQMRFLLWDKTHDAPFGLIGLQSPVLKMAVRDRALGLPKEDLDFWINQSLHAQRVGALPPYNQLLGGKMAALALTCNELTEAYSAKYHDSITLLKGRQIASRLLFMTTTSAFGRSSMYNRLKYHGEVIAECLGYTQGSGSFHIPDDLYAKLIGFLASRDVPIERNYGHGPSRKLKLISTALRLLGLPSFEFHGIKREFYLFPLVRNLRKVIQESAAPIPFDRSLRKLEDFWMKRWALPRAERRTDWLDFSATHFLAESKRLVSAS
jgi:hypothetical protein